MAGRFSISTVFEAIDRLSAPVGRMRASVMRFSRSASKGLQSVNRVISSTVRGFGRLTKAALQYGAVGVGAIAAAVTVLVREFSKIEDAEAAFTPLLGGAKRAKEMVAALNATAASTPFQFETLAGSANQLLPVMNGNIEETIRTVRMLGDTAGGNAQKLESVTRGYTKAMLKGKVDMESLNMIAEAGVPIFQDLAAVMGTEVGEKFFKTISAGKVTTDQLTKAFEKLTGEGGKYHRGMEIASKTTSGMWSTMKDNIALTAAALGEILAPTVKGLIADATKLAMRVREWVGANRELINTKFLAFVEQAKRFLGALLRGLEFVAEHHDTILKVAGSITALIVVLKVLSAVMMVVNLVMMANPIGLIIAGIALLIVAIAGAIIWWDDITAAVKRSGRAFDLMVVALAALTGPIGWLIGAGVLLYKHWEPIKAFFVDLWDGVVSAFDSAMESIRPLMDWLREAAALFVKIHSAGFSAAANFLGIGGGDEAASPQGGQMVSPQERTARSIEERRTVGEVVIRDGTGRAEETRPLKGTGALLMPATGGM